MNSSNKKGNKKIQGGGKYKFKSDKNGDWNCGKCNVRLSSKEKSMIQCEGCLIWLCLDCADVSENRFNEIAELNGGVEWICPDCSGVKEAKYQDDIKNLNMLIENQTKENEKLKSENVDLLNKVSALGGDITTLDEQHNSCEIRLY